MTVSLSSGIRIRSTVCIGRSSGRSNVITLGDLPSRRFQTPVIEMQSRKPGEAGAQLRQISRQISADDASPDYEYE
jgi:hypothetical protein